MIQAIILALALVTPVQQGVTPEDVARRVQAVYNQEECISSDFTSIYTSGTSGKQIEERGDLSIKKPGMMRWDYREPDRKYYISDGKMVYWYVPADRKVTVFDLAAADQQQTHILFLMGRGDLVRDFAITFTEDVKPLHEGSYMLRLVPKQQEEFDYLVLEVNPRDYYVERIISYDPLGNAMEYRFSNIRRDDLPASHFAFEAPKGVEVVRADAPAEAR